MAQNYKYFCFYVHSSNAGSHWTIRSKIFLLLRPEEKSIRPKKRNKRKALLANKKTNKQKKHMLPRFSFQFYTEKKIIVKFDLYHSYRSFKY